MSDEEDAKTIKRIEQKLLRRPASFEQLTAVRESLDELAKSLGTKAYLKSVHYEYEEGEEVLIEELSIDFVEPAQFLTLTMDTGRTCSRAPNPHRKQECTDPEHCCNPE